MGQAAYQRIAVELRARIQSGDLGPGAKLPTERALREQYSVSTTVVKIALGLLQSEGLIEGRRGSGNYVRSVQRLTRLAHARDQRTIDGSPFATDAVRAGRRGTWEHESVHDVAHEDVASRLGIAVGDPVMRTSYRFFADDEPVQLSTSWEPLAVTGGTPIEWPEDGPATGVVARFDWLSRQRPDRRIGPVEERVTARPAWPDEIEALRLPPRGATVLAIRRTYFAADRAVETADIVLVGERYEVVYRYQID